MEWTPVPIANVLLDLLGPLGKPLALWGAASVVLALGAPLALLAYRSPGGWTGWTLTTVLVAALAWSLARPVTVLGVATLMVTFLGLLAWLGRRRAAARPAPGGRRRFLLEAARNVGAISLASVLPLAASAVRLATFGRGMRPPLFSFAPPPARAAGYALAGLTPEVTSLPAFYRMSKNVADPVLDAGVWSLSVSGRVRRTLNLTLDDLSAIGRVDQYVTMQCVSNPVGGPLWSAALFSGVPLDELIRRAEPLPGVRWVSFEGSDGHHEQLSIERALDPSVLVVYGMNGEWLEPSHGFPTRLLVTGLYGFRSVKWLTHIELLAEPRYGHWEVRGWTASDIHTTARVDAVQTGPDGAIAAGVAFAGRRGVSAVEVRVDGGPWLAAELHVPPLSEAMWVQWRARLDLPTGDVRVEARAIDGRGVPQDELPRAQFPNAATGLHGLAIRS